MIGVLFDEDSILLKIHVVPNSSKNEFIKEPERIKLKITAPPVDNKANKFIVEYLSKKFRVPKTSISIIKGELSKDKTIKMFVSDAQKRELISEFFIGL